MGSSVNRCVEKQQDAFHMTRTDVKKGSVGALLLPSDTGQDMKDEETVVMQSQD